MLSIVLSWRGAVESASCGVQMVVVGVVGPSLSCMLWSLWILEQTIETLLLLRRRQMVEGKKKGETVLSLVFSAASLVFVRDVDDVVSCVRDGGGVS